MVSKLSFGSRWIAPEQAVHDFLELVDGRALGDGVGLLDTDEGRLLSRTGRDGRNDARHQRARGRRDHHHSVDPLGPDRIGDFERLKRHPRNRLRCDAVFAEKLIEEPLIFGRVVDDTDPLLGQVDDAGELRCARSHEDDRISVQDGHRKPSGRQGHVAAHHREIGAPSVELGSAFPCAIGRDKLQLDRAALVVRAIGRKVRDQTHIRRLAWSDGDPQHRRLGQERNPKATAATTRQANGEARRRARFEMRAERLASPARDLEIGRIVDRNRACPPPQVPRPPQYITDKCGSGSGSVIKAFCSPKAARRRLGCRIGAIASNRAEKIAVPTLTCVAPWAIASS